MFALSWVGNIVDYFCIRILLAGTVSYLRTASGIVLDCLMWGVHCSVEDCCSGHGCSPSTRIRAGEDCSGALSGCSLHFPGLLISVGRSWLGDSWGISRWAWRSGPSGWSGWSWRASGLGGCSCAASGPGWVYCTSSTSWGGRLLLSRVARHVLGHI